VDSNTKTFKAGDTLMSEGEKGEHAYIIETGTVEILVKKGTHLIQIGTRGEGSLIGEMAMIDDQPRTATVRAVDDCTAIEISRNDFASHVNQADPILKMFLHVIMTRYRDMLTRMNFKPANNIATKAEDIEHSTASHAEALTTIKVHNELKVALKENQLELFYQPIIDVQKNVIAGFEALMRWHHPKKGMISPSIFIPVAEESGLIGEMSKYALKQSCETVNKLKQTILKDNHGDNPLFVSVNFSVKDFTDGTFPENVKDILTKKQTTPHNIKLEITESLFMEEPEQAKNALEKCHDYGVQVAIDDFGTGYSSLSYLHYFPIDTLKIDQSFIRSMLVNDNSFALVKSIVGLAKNLNMNIIAEGIETIEEAEAIKKLDCEMCQGFYFARPMPMTELIPFIENWKMPKVI